MVFYKNIEWSELSLSEKKDLYYDKKQEYIEYLDDTFTLRLELKNEESCNKPYSDYQRCLGVKNVLWGGMKYSTARAGFYQTWICIKPFHHYFECLGIVDTPQQRDALKKEDQERIQKLFPK